MDTDMDIDIDIDMNIEKLKGLKVAVLMGGPSSEREISLRTGNAVEKALRNQGIQVVGIDVDQTVLDKLRVEGVALAFLALHGRYGEDGSIQGLLEIAGINYTGSGILASALAFHKIKAKQIFQFCKIPTPRFLALTRRDFPSALEGGIEMGMGGYPLVIKPAQEGSTIGISLAKTQAELLTGCQNAFRYGEEILIEEFIEGREVTVGILGDQPLPVIEVVPHSGFYDYEAKYTKGKTEYLVPAQLKKNLWDKVQSIGRQAHQALGCKGVSRVDIRLDKLGEPFVLEVNTIPGMTETSLLPKAAGVAGLSFEELVLRILSLAMVIEGK